MTEFDCSEMALCRWQDVIIQLPTTQLSVIHVSSIFVDTDILQYCCGLHGRVSPTLPMFSPLCPQQPSWHRQPSSMTPTTPARSWWPQMPLEWGLTCEWDHCVLCHWLNLWVGSLCCVSSGQPVSGITMLCVISSTCEWDHYVVCHQLNPWVRSLCCVS